VLLAVAATGSIGRYVAAEALREGYCVRALVRDASRARQLPPDVEAIIGDLTQPASLGEAVAGIDAIVFTHGSPGGRGAEAVDYGGVRSVLAALTGPEVRVALMTTIGVTDRKAVRDWKRRAERLIRASGLPYTIARPGWFDDNNSDQQRLVMLQGDKRQSGTPRDGVVARRQLAEVLVRSLRSETALRKTFELVAETGPEQQDLDMLFAALDADSASALDAVHDTANMPLDEEPRTAINDLERIRSSPFAAIS
jgi:uncharacterized protein YbjT (DUF2867 family)